MAEKASGVTVSAANPLTAKFDFSKVEEGGSGIRPKHLPEGEYVAVIKNVVANNAKSSGNPQWVFHISPEEHPAAVFPYYCGLTSEQAWKVRNILAGVGVSVPKSVKQINASKLIGKKLGIVLEDDEYNGKMKSVIDAIIPVTEVVDRDMPDEDDDDEEDMEVEEAPKKTRRTKKPEPEPEADDDDDDDLDLDDL